MSADTTRRRAMKLVAGAAGGIAVGATSVGCGGARAAPEAESTLPLADLVVGQRLKIDHHGEPVELQRAEDGSLTARSLICTHEYCRMFWHPGSDGYRCPCHGAVFGADGRPRTGPVSQPMWQLPVRVERDLVIVGGV